MKVQRYDGTDIRRVITGLITSSPVVARISSRWPTEGLFASRWENMIGGWCVDYFKKYGRAPGKEIETVFLNADVRNDEESAAIDKFLRGLSAEYSQNGNGQESPEYVIDLAGQLFRRVKVQRDAEAALEHIKFGDIDAAEAIFAQHRQVEFGTGSVDMPDIEPEFWDQVFDEDDATALFSWNGKSANEFFGREFSRDSFISFMAKEKGAKSFWLLDVAVRSVQAGCRTAYFCVGDMSRKKLGRRIARRITMTPKEPKTISIPDEWPPAQELPTCIQSYREPIIPSQVYRTLNKWTHNKNRLRFQVYPAATASASMLEALLKEWARDGWVADVIVIDYADILAVPPGIKDEQEGINQTWMHLRRMSQTMHACVVTATQADAKSYDAVLLSRKNFSRDKRKYGHVTAFYGINQTPEEKNNNITRINCLASRDESYNEQFTLMVAGNLDISCPSILSR